MPIEPASFERELRNSIVKASYDLHRSRMAFAIFRHSRCNPAFWKRTEEGGFLLLPDAKPSDAIRDIYRNGFQYATECATAMVIVFYKAVLDVFPEDIFNALFERIYLMDWQHLDRDLGIRRYENVLEGLPGDCRYFKNPDVDPLTQEWQGENAIDLGNGTYYGHGIGITNAEGIIRELNRHRISGSQTSAYLMNSATRPDFRSLAQKYYSLQPGI